LKAALLRLVEIKGRTNVALQGNACGAYSNGAALDFEFLRRQRAHFNSRLNRICWPRNVEVFETEPREKPACIGRRERAAHGAKPTPFSDRVMRTIRSSSAP
jgi:hypothetical protein